MRRAILIALAGFAMGFAAGYTFAVLTSYEFYSRGSSADLYRYNYVTGRAWRAIALPDHSEWSEIKEVE